MKKIISIILSIISIISIFSIPVNAKEIEYVDIYMPFYLDCVYDEGERIYYFPNEEEFIRLYPDAKKRATMKWQSEVDTDYPNARHYFKCCKCEKEYDTFEDAVKNDTCGRATISVDLYNKILDGNYGYYTQYYYLKATLKRTYYYCSGMYENIIENDPNNYHRKHSFLSMYDFSISHYIGICQEEMLTYLPKYTGCVHKGWQESSFYYTIINYDGKEFTDHQVQPINETGIDYVYTKTYWMQTLSDTYTGKPNYELSTYVEEDDYFNMITPTTEPTITPTVEPITTPTETPTTIPTQVPTIVPTQIPTIKPTIKPNITTENTTEVEPTKVIGTNVYVLKSDGTAEISGMVPTSTVKIPDTIVDTAGNVRKVTSISANAFKNNKKVKSIIIGKNVTIIKKNAFYGCKNLKSVNIRSTKLKSIEKNAFKNCKKLKKVTFKSKKIKFGKNSFKNIAKKAIFKVPTNKKTSYRKQLLKVTNKKIVVK